MKSQFSIWHLSDFFFFFHFSFFFFFLFFGGSRENFFFFAWVSGWFLLPPLKSNGASLKYLWPNMHCNRPRWGDLFLSSPDISRCAQILSIQNGVRDERVKHEITIFHLALEWFFFLLFSFFFWGGSRENFFFFFFFRFFFFSLEFRGAFFFFFLKTSYSPLEI